MLYVLFVRAIPTEQLILPTVQNLTCLSVQQLSGSICNYKQDSQEKNISCFLLRAYMPDQAGLPDD